MSQLGLVKNQLGLGVDLFVSNYSISELQAISNDSTQRDSLPSNALVICALNESTLSTEYDDEGVYGLCIIDNNKSVSPITFFDTIFDKTENGFIKENSGLKLVESDNARILKVKTSESKGLTIDESGNLAIKLAPNSGLVLTEEGLMTESAYSMKADTIDV